MKNKSIKNKKKTQQWRYPLTLILMTLVLTLSIAAFFKLYEERLIGEPLDEEIVIRAHRHYLNGPFAQLCKKPSCNTGEHISQVENWKRRSAWRTIEEHYYRDLPPVRWFYTKNENYYGWVPEYSTRRRKPFRKSFKITTANNIMALCPVVECPVADLIIVTMPADRPTLLASSIVYRYYSPRKRAEAWLFTKYKDKKGWVSIMQTNLDVPGPHFYKPAW